MRAFHHRGLRGQSCSSRTGWRREGMPGVALALDDQGVRFGQHVGGREAVNALPGKGTQDGLSGLVIVVAANAGGVVAGAVGEDPVRMGWGALFHVVSGRYASARYVCLFDETSVGPSGSSNIPTISQRGSSIVNTRLRRLGRRGALLVRACLGRNARRQRSQLRVSRRGVCRSGARPQPPAQAQARS